MPPQKYWCWDQREVSVHDPCPYCHTPGLYEDRSGPRLMPTLWCPRCEQMIALGHPLRRQSGTGREGRESATALCNQCREPVRVLAWLVRQNVVCFYLCCGCGGISQCLGLVRELKVLPDETPTKAA